MRPSVSIIVPIYNAEAYLNQCLESIREQTLKDIEIICIDDGSTDESPSIVDAHAAVDDRVTVVHKQNGGYGKGVNTGLDLATGEYVGIVEPDDYVDETMFGSLYDAASHIPERPDIVKGAYWSVSDADSSDEAMVPARYLHRVQSPGRPFTIFDNPEFLFHHPSIWSAIYRRDFIIENNIRMKELPGASWVDNPWFMETYLDAKSIIYIDKCLYYYRESPDSALKLKDPSIIWDRWFDMDEIIRAHGVTDQGILEAHYNRGCCYMRMIERGYSMKDDNVNKALHAMADRIDSDVVMSSPAFPKVIVDAYQRVKNPFRYRIDRISRRLWRSSGAQQTESPR